MGVLLSLFASLFSGAATAAEDALTIESIAGDHVVIITSGTTLQPHPAQVGEKIHFWDVIETSKRAAAQIRYPDGSVVVVGRDTKFTVQPKQGGTQYSHLDWGQVRAQIEKPEHPDPKAPPRFVIRTKTATMGVRGTDFVAGYDAVSAQSSLHTIEGTVDISAEESKVMAWQGTPVNAGHAADMGLTSAQPSLSSFAADSFKAQIKSEQPELVAMRDRPATGENSSETSLERAPASLNEPSYPAPAAPNTFRYQETSSRGERSFNLFNFRVGAASIMQMNNIQYTTAELSWNPTLRLFGPLSIMGYGGGYALKNAQTSASIPVMKGGGLLDLRLINTIHVEAGGGMETLMTDTYGTLRTVCFMGNLAWHFAEGKWIDTIYGGGTMLNLPSPGNQVPLELSAGVGLHF